MNTSIDELEIAKFAQHASEWWNKEGPLKTLHDINPVRIEFIKKISPLSEQSVLDVGCGGGVLSESMAINGAVVTGLDVEEQAILAARMHAEAQDISVKYLCQPVETFYDELFDIVTCMEMLEHASDPRLVIENCARLLKPGGYLFLSTINRTLQAYASVVIAAEYLLGLLPRQTHDYDKFIKPSELAAMVRSVGLEVIAMEGMSYHPFTRKAVLQDSIKANYLLACRRSL